MKISVVIPSFGQAAYLAEAIDSALNQTYKDVEVIVVDDGSIDGSLSIARKFLPAIKLVVQVNKGLASARNAGIMNATGEYILPLDADDVLLDHAVERIVKEIEGTDADIVAPSIRCFGKANQDVILMPNPTLEDFKEGNRLAYCSAIRKSALLETGGYSPRMDTQGGWEDLHLWYDLLSRGKKVVTIQEPLVLYRTKENSMWQEAEKNRANLWGQIVKDFPHTTSHVR